MLTVRLAKERLCLCCCILSNAAIVAREMGIPAVVGCGNATMLLKTGDRVRVDGGEGTVEILNP